MTTKLNLKTLLAAMALAATMAACNPKPTTEPTPTPPDPPEPSIEKIDIKTICCVAIYVVLLP